MAELTLEEDRKELVVVFRGGGAMHLECRLTPEASKEGLVPTGGVKKGRTVTLRGAGRARRTTTSTSCWRTCPW